MDITMTIIKMKIASMIFLAAFITFSEHFFLVIKQMTVLSTNYATIDEVWGTSFVEPTKPLKKKTKKTSHDALSTSSDPICELYSNKLGNYTESDLVKYANDQASYQRSMKPQQLTQEYLDDKMSREPKQPNEIPEYEKQFDMYLPNMYDDIDEISYDNAHAPTKNIDMMNVSGKAIPNTPQPHPTMRHVFEQNYQKNEFRNYKKETNKLDIFLFIVSGIILIFLMEQFIKIGSILHSGRI
jgi:hypothetical protein